MCDLHCNTVHPLTQTMWTDKLLFYSQSDSPSQREHHELDVWCQSLVSSLECYFTQQRKKGGSGKSQHFLPLAIKESAVRMK